LIDPTAQLFSQAWSEKTSACIKACCPVPCQQLAVVYANFMKSAAQRLGPTLAITRPLDADTEIGGNWRRLWCMAMLDVLHDHHLQVWPELHPS
jgi:hypothetical protein